MSMPNKTRVQVATDEQFTDIIVDKVGDYKSTLALASAELPVGSNLYIRGMHGHPDTGDSPWSAVHQFKVMTPYANELYYTAGDYTFTVPAGVNEVCIAAVPGADYSAAGELLKAYTGKTVACVAGNNTVPVGIDSITLSGKGAAGGTTASHYAYSSRSSGVIGQPATLSKTTPSNIAITITWGETGTSISAMRQGSGNSIYYMGDAGPSWGLDGNAYVYVYYNLVYTNTTGASTTAVVNGTTYTFPGGVGGAAAITEHTVPVNPAIGATINANIASGGALSYSYSAYAINALGTLLGNNFSLSPVAKDVGTYVGGIAAWRNAIPVSPGDTIPVHVSAGGAVNIIWGTGRSFPDSEA